MKILCRAFLFMMLLVVFTGFSQVHETCGDESVTHVSWLWDSGDREPDGSMGSSDGGLSAGSFSVELNHSTLKRKTVLKNRTVTTASGTVVDTAALEGNNHFFTKMSEDSLVLHVGLTDWAEMYVKGSVFNKSLSETDDPEPGFGAGFRANTDGYDFDDGSFLYFYILGSYTSGKVAYDITDTYGNHFRKESSFNETSLGVEGRWVKGRLGFYLAYAYTLYSEDSVKTQVFDAPDIMILTDEMEQESASVVWGGLNVRITDYADVFIEYHGLNREGPAAGMVLSF